MKKIFKIAAYDFRRLMLNPITLIVMAVALVATLILGATYKIPTTPAYSANTIGETTKELFNNFDSSNPNCDTKNSLNQLISEAKSNIAAQSSFSDHQTLSRINSKFKAIADNVERYAKGLGSTYIENENIDEIKVAAQELKGFLTYFSQLEIFESNLFFLQKDFEQLNNLSTYFHQTANLNESVVSILDNLVKNFENFKLLNSIILNKAYTWEIDTDNLNSYIVKGEAKRNKIKSEMDRVFNLVSLTDTGFANDMKSLITSFKQTCESTKFAVQAELYLLLQNHFKDLGNFYKYKQISKEDTELALSKINFILEDENVYFTQYQQALNFNIASYEVSVYDNTYFLMAIIGFFTVLFGIFCAYKLFGRDRKTGQMDVILSQDVTFGQVFCAKFLAILLATTFIISVFLIFTLVWSLLFNPTLSNGILAVFNLSSPYIISPFLFLIIKVLGIELQVVFWSVITIFLMNLSRKFEVFFAVAVALFLIATICNIFLNGSIVYCLFPFIHADLTCMLGGGSMGAGFLQTPLYAYGNFFISLAYYVVVVGLLFNFTKQLFKKN